MRIYQDLNDFYQDRGGRYSPESDYGAHNTDDLGAFAPSPLFSPPVRVSHVHSTADFYAVQLTPTTEKVVLISTTPEGLTEPQVHRILQDWARTPSPGRPLSWFTERINASPEEDTHP